jgi:predicted secreted Zn-dependent protease
VKFAIAEPSTCYLASAQFDLLLVTSHPKLVGNLSASLRRRWIALDAAVKAGRNKDWQWAVQAVHAMDAATANLSMKEDPKCYKLKSFVTDRLDFLDRQRRERSRQYGEALSGINGAVGKAAAAFYGSR